METIDGQLICIFNGEIYNFRTLRSELQALGHRFKSASDTEVLLHGYRQWGTALPTRLSGMFAFAIWDKREETLFLARDRFGEKPLYFTWCGDGFVFASEAKALLTWPGIERRPNLTAIHDYLSFKFVPGRFSAFEGIERIQPAQCMVIGPRHSANNRPVPRTYWTLPEVDTNCEDKPRSDLIDAFWERFDHSTRLRMVADVPVGAFLSGGVDSSTVVAQASQVSPCRLQTFSAGFAQEGFDEADFARRVAERFGTLHRNYTMDAGLIGMLPDVVWNHSEPFADPSALVTTALAGEVRKHVKVALSGDGGDEVFLGYDRYRRFAEAIVVAESGNDRPLAARLERLFGPPGLGANYAHLLFAFRDLNKEWSYGPELLDKLLRPSWHLLRSILDDATSDNAIEIAGRADLQGYLPDDLMVKTDIATMSHGLEARCPFLDHELVEWAVALSQSARVFPRQGHLEMKGLLKSAMEPIVDADILYRPKLGFGVPVADWLRGQMREISYDLLTSRAFRERGLLRPQYVTWLLDTHASGEEDLSSQLWCLVCLELWFRTFIDKIPSGPVSLPIPDAKAISREVAAE